MSNENANQPHPFVTSDHAINPPSKAATLTAIFLCKNEQAALEKPHSTYNSHRNTGGNKHKPRTYSRSHTTIMIPRSLPLPTPLVALPQLSPTPTSPILRALPLTPLPNLPSPLLLSIIDAYNLATSSQPLFAALDAAAGILGLVPEPHMQLASYALTGAVAVGEEEVSRGRGEALLKRVNAEVLAGLGVVVEVVRGREVSALVGDEVWEDETSAERRVRALGGRVLPVTCDVAAPVEQVGRMQRFVAREQAKEVERYWEEQRKKAEKRREWEAKLAERREKVEAKARKREDEASSLAKERDTEQKISRLLNEYQRHIEKLTEEAEALKAALERRTSQEKEKRIERERRKVEKLNWLVLRNN